MTRDSRDELLIGFIEDDLPQAERQRVEKLLREDSAYAKRHEELAAADRQFYLVAERAWKESGLEGVRLVNPVTGKAPAGERTSARRDVGGGTIIDIARRWIFGPYATPIAAALLVGMMGVGAMIADKNKNDFASDKPVVAANVHESNMALLPAGERLWTGRDYMFDANGVVTLSLSDNSNSIMYAKGPSTLTFTSSTSLTQNGGSAYYILREGANVYHIDLPGNLSVSTTGAMFEVHDGVLRLQDGAISIGGGVFGSGISLVAGEKVDLDTKDAKPVTLDNSERQSIGVWTGQFQGRRTSSKSRKPSRTTPLDAEPSEDSSPDFATPTEMASVIPGDSFAAISLRLPSGLADQLSVHGPILAAFPPTGKLPLVMIQSADVARTSQNLVDMVGGHLRPIPVGVGDENNALPGSTELHWRDRSSPGAARGEPAGYLVNRGPLLMLVAADVAGRPLQQAIAPDPGEEALSEAHIARRLELDLSEADLSFVVALGRLIRTRTGSDAWHQLMGIAPEAMLSGRGILSSQSLRIAASIPADFTTTKRTLSERGSLGLLPYLPAESAVMVSMTTTSLGDLVGLWDELLLREVYRGNRNLLDSQREEFEDTLGFSLASEFAKVTDGRLSFAVLPPRGDSEVPGFVLALGLNDPIAAEEMFSRRLFAQHHLLGATRDAIPDPEFAWRVHDGVLLIGSTAEALDSTATPLMNADEAAELERLGGAPPLLACVSTVGLRAWTGQYSDSTIPGPPLAVWAHADIDASAWRIESTIPASPNELEALMSGFLMPVKASMKKRANIRTFLTQLDQLNGKIHEFVQLKRRPPANLKELAESGLLTYTLDDPFNPDAGSLRYEVVPETGAWSLWSFGPDGRDDGSLIRWDETMSLSDPGDLVVRGQP